MVTGALLQMLRQVAAGAPTPVMGRGLWFILTTELTKTWHWPFKKVDENLDTDSSQNWSRISVEKFSAPAVDFSPSGFTPTDSTWLLTFTSVSWIPGCLFNLSDLVTLLLLLWTLRSKVTVFKELPLSLLPTSSIVKAAPPLSPPPSSCVHKHLINSCFCRRYKRYDII